VKTDPSTATPIQKNQQPTPNNPIIDWRLVEQRYKGKAALIERIRKAAHETYHATPQTLRLAVQQQDLDTLYQVAHSLKGSAGNLEANLLSESATLILDNIRTSKDDVALQLGSELAEHLDRFIAELDAKALYH
jgi:HPt (histidine-containing phosphotransfer) domain-containing protein